MQIFGGEKTQKKQKSGKESHAGRKAMRGGMPPRLADTKAGGMPPYMADTKAGGMPPYMADTKADGMPPYMADTKENAEREGEKSPNEISGKERRGYKKPTIFAFSC